MTLSTEVKSHVLVTYNDSHYFITPRQNEALKGLGKEDRIELDGNSIKVSNISEIFTTQKYYETYPNKKPEIQRGDEFAKYGRIDAFKIATSKSAVEGLIRGLKRFIDEEKSEGRQTPKADEMLKSWLKKYEVKYSKQL
jgi:hypothetical protein